MNQENKNQPLEELKKKYMRNVAGNFIFFMVIGLLPSVLLELVFRGVLTSLFSQQIEFQQIYGVLSTVNGFVWYLICIVSSLITARRYFEKDLLGGLFNGKVIEDL